MTNICPNSGCDALYDLADDDVGRTFPCRKCGAMLIVEQGGLRVLSRPAEQIPTAEAVPPRQTEHAPANPPPVLPIIEPRSTPSRSESRPMRPLNQPGAVSNVVFNVLYGVGAGFVVLFGLLPVTDATRISARSAAIDAGDQRIARISGGASDSARKDWDSRKKELQEDVDDARIWGREASQVYSWGLLFGFLCLAAASVGLLGTNQPTTRKVLGTVTLAGIVLFFLVFASTTMGFR
ncbi:MAG TPA: hypothetical protein VMS17_33925 [Gemmataceae bacterium]|nr:hypothetical protein [Gemmataceae bacterium]